MRERRVRERGVPCLNRESGRGREKSEILTVSKRREKERGVAKVEGARRGKAGGERERRDVLPK